MNDWFGRIVAKIKEVISMESVSHPVWDVYDKLRTADLNIRYYSIRLSRHERINLIIEILLAITSSSSVVGGLGVWTGEYGHQIWQILLSVSAFIAVIKPFLGLPKKIKDTESTLTGYRILYNDLDLLKIDISSNGSYNDKMQKEFRKILDRSKVVTIKPPESKEDNKLKKLCEQEVNLRFPKDSFFVPKGE
ncbi:MAG: hypothetical protein HQL91_02425 [Magnetococcales bacterium]|nr:hypothetical protein [Magnetococcales bacterium]